ncbi:hypothetical protein [Cytophaga aurantiaca]|uniref:hypothetical protein n=1 Tax=Cytophaga aurantiaca TaxID=29530 RepID=UPI00036BE6A1|nr:hypothetical protein [Cytophaga aurantiaca]
MNKSIIFIALSTLLACSENKENKQVLGIDHLHQVISDKLNSKYSLIKDNLYRDAEGNLYLKSVNNEDIDNHTKHDVWLKEVYCDTCWTPSEDGPTDITELKDFVDITTFHYDTTYENEGVVIYADKKYLYRHKIMADGGTITVEKK